MNAAATVESVSSDETTVSYKVSGGAEYKFNRAYMEQKNEDMENDGDDTTSAPYDFKDYTTFPYVNLGSLVLDGIGSADTKTQFNEQTGSPKTFNGYNYTIQSSQNGGVYFTRTEVMKTNTSGENTNLYYLVDKAGAWNAIDVNKDKTDTSVGVETVALNTTNTTDALFYIENGAHKYMYIKETALYRADGLGEEKQVRLTAKVPSGAILWKMNGDYVYYTAASSDGTGNAISRINYKGNASDYFSPEDQFKPQTINYLNFNSSWYMPEIYGDTVLYSNVKTYGAGSGYNYIYAAKLTNVTVQNEEYKKVQDYIAEYSVDADLQALMRYYFRTGDKTELYKAVEDLYNEYRQAEYKKFKENTELKQESDFVAFVGKMTDADEEAIQEAWANYLLTETEEEETESKKLETWVIVLIAVGGALVLAAAILVPVLIHSSKKKAAKAKADATVNAYKRKKIDTTDDKSIDVYADEEPAQVEEEAGEQESVEEVENEPVLEETVEENAEETAQEEPAQETQE